MFKRERIKITNKFMFMEGFHIPDIFVARLVPINTHIYTSKRSIAVADNTGRNDISSRNGVSIG